MERRVLIVESQQDFALSMASVLRGAGYQTAMAQSAAEALRELEKRRPDLVVLRAELPDQNGFNVCAQLKKGQAGANLRVLLMSSEVGRDGLSQHAASPSAADGYLAIPFEMGDLTQMTQDILPAVAAQELEDSLDNALLGNGPQQPAPVPPPLPAPSAPAGGPPRLPRRERRSAITEEDRAFLERAFQSIAERKAELLAESRQLRRAPARPELKGTPEGKIQLLRDELKLREAQVARIAEIWSVRERELLTVEDRLHDKDVEVQGFKMQVEDMQRRLLEAKAAAEQREREHGAAIQELLEQKFVGEKEVIETVSAKEKELYTLRRELTQREEELTQKSAELDDQRQAHEQLEKQLQVHVLESEVREKSLNETVQAREQELAATREELTHAQEQLSATVAEHDARDAQLSGELSAIQETLEQARAEREATVRGLEEQLSAAASREESAAQAFDRLFQERKSLEATLSAQIAELEQEVSSIQGERDSLRLELEGTRQALEERTGELSQKCAALERELSDTLARNERSEADLNATIQQHLERIGELEGEVEAARTHLADREAELQEELSALGEAAQEREVELSGQLDAASEREH
ncbi:MAG: response regulator, partial [Myxococcaceae bacterium]|nr:response regulator [Myxococcaceae bacterium]